VSTATAFSTKDLSIGAIKAIIQRESRPKDTEEETRHGHSVTKSSHRRT